MSLNLAVRKNWLYCFILFFSKLGITLFLGIKTLSLLDYFISFLQFLAALNKQCWPSLDPKKSCLTQTSVGTNFHWIQFHHTIKVYLKVNKMKNQLGSAEVECKDQTYNTQLLVSCTESAKDMYLSSFSFFFLLCIIMDIRKLYKMLHSNKLIYSSYKVTKKYLRWVSHLFWGQHLSNNSVTLLDRIPLLCRMDCFLARD